MAVCLTMKLNSFQIPPVYFNGNKLGKCISFHSREWLKQHNMDIVCTL